MATPTMAYTLVTVRPVGDTIDWGQLGATFSTFASPQPITSIGGVTGTISDSATLERLDQSNGWSGNFTSSSSGILSPGYQNYLFFDSVHPTALAHQLTADIAYHTLTTAPLA